MVRPRGGEGECSHDLVRFNSIAKQIARAILGAVAALVAGGFADARLNFGRLEFTFDDVMCARQNNHAGGSFRNRGVEIIGVLAHHQTPDQQNRVVCGQPPGLLDALAKRCAQRHPERRGRFYSAGDREHLVRDRQIILRGGDVDESLDVIHHHADVQRNTAGWNQLAGDIVDQVIFITGRIIIAQQMHTHIRALARGRNRFHGVFLFGLDADNPLPGPDCRHGQLYAAHQFSGVIFHDDGVLVEQRFTFCAVSDDGLGLIVDLDMRWESATPRANNSGQSDFFCKVHSLIRIHSRPFGQLTYHKRNMP